MDKWLYVVGALCFLAAALIAVRPEARPVSVTVVESGKPQMVAVEWQDAVGKGGWVKVNALPTPARIVTVGWLIVSDNDKVTVASSVDLGDESEVGEVISIPRGMVTKVTVLK